MSHYPRWVHHPVHKAKLVKSSEEHQVLGEGWGDDSKVWREPKVEAVAAPEEVQVEQHIQELPKAPAQAERPKQKGKKGKQSA